MKDSNKVEELNAYLTNYPNGTFKSLALARIAALQDGPSTATRNLTTGSGIDPSTFTEEASQITEDQLGLERASAATCSAASPGSASTSRRPASSTKRPAR